MRAITKLMRVLHCREGEVPDRIADIEALIEIAAEEGDNVIADEQAIEDAMERYDNTVSQ